MKTIYERLMAGETLRVQFKGQPAHAHKGAFKVGPLWMFGTMCVSEKSDWKRFASIGGITINKRRRHAMEPGEMEAWCSSLEEVNQ